MGGDVRMELVESARQETEIPDWPISRSLLASDVLQPGQWTRAPDEDWCRSGCSVRSAP